MSRRRVVIVGGGFGGLNAAKGLAGVDVEVTVVDRSNHHLFQPLLYQVATGILSEGVVAPALRGVLRGQDNVEVLLAEVGGFDLDAAAGACDASRRTGAVAALRHADRGDRASLPSYFGHDEWEEVAPGLKTLEDARWVRTHILGAFEMAELATDDERRRAWLTFVIVGAGPTGVELTGEIATLARRILPRDFRRVATRDTRIVLIDAGPAVLPSFPEKLQRRAARRPRGMGRRGAHLDGGARRAGRRDRRAPAGRRVRAHRRADGDLGGRREGGAAGGGPGRGDRRRDRPRRPPRGAARPHAAGPSRDLRSRRHDGARRLPGVAQVAMQQGRYAAAVIAARVAGRAAPPPFRYKDKGAMAQIGPRRAVVDAFGIRVGGFVGSFMWAFVHVLYLIGWGNRFSTLLRWLFQLTTRNRSQRVVDVEHAAFWGPARSGRGRRAGSLWSGMRKGDKGVKGGRVEERHDGVRDVSTEGPDRERDRRQSRADGTRRRRGSS